LDIDDMASPVRSPASLRQDAFTLVEMLVALVLFTLILLVILAITQTTGKAWRDSRSKVDAFQGARQAFENITRTLSQATLNTYYDYLDSAGRSPRETGYAGADHYGRQSELHFLSGKSLVPGQVGHSVFFQSPAGYANGAQYQNMETLLNACGFYVVRGPDDSRPPFLAGLPNAPANETRFRLMQFLQPSEQLTVYSEPSGATWFKQPLAASAPPVEQLAVNVVAFVVLPRLSGGDAAESGGGLLSPDYEYDSRAAGAPGPQQARTHHQLPALVEIILVAVDEKSARRIEEQNIQLPTSLFTQAEMIETDLAQLEDFLNNNRLVYRAFRAMVPLRNSKWSS
jgi:uncharacterized protein (TIGR02599 family)